MDIVGNHVPALPGLGGVTLTVSLMRAVLSAAAVCALSAPARASMIFTEGNTPQAGDENVLFDDQVGNPVFGTTNQTDLVVRFTSISEMLLFGNGGQARVESADDDETLTNLTIDIPGGFFTSLIFNPFDGDPNNGLAHVTVKLIGEPDATFNYELGNGNNFLTMVAIDGEKIQSVTIDAEAGFVFTDVRQFRIGGAQLTPVPEPSTMALAMLGVAGLGLGGLRRRRAEIISA
jgi:hypothetical protein